MKIALLALACVLAASCATTIARWPDRSAEKGSRSEVCEKRSNIFADYLWTTPPVAARRVDGRFELGGRVYDIAESGGRMTLEGGGVKLSAPLLTSNKVYPELASLRQVVTVRQRWVPRTTFVTENVPVTKSRTVTSTSFDAKGMAHTDFRTEFYTDWEIHMVSKTEWYWDNYSETSYEISDSRYYEFDLPGNDHVLVFDKTEGGAVVHYLLNASYYVVKENADSFFGAKDTNVLFVDAQSNGSFFDPEDRVLINVWNPYDKDSRHRSISRYMDNYWYSVGYLANNFFLKCALAGDSVRFEYGNAAYLGVKDTGTLTLRNIAGVKPKVSLNGKGYSLAEGRARNIQFGQYHLVASVPGRLDFESYFTVDERNRAVDIEYREQPKGGTVEIAGVYAADFKLFTGDGEKVLLSPKSVSLAVGRHTLTIDVDGCRVSKTFDIREDGRERFDFEAEIAALAGKRAR